MKAALIFVVVAIAFSGVFAQTSVCQICNIVVTEAESYLTASNYTAAEVEALLNTECAKLPSDAASTCELFVNDYLSVVLQQMFNGTSPATVCQTMDLCNATKPNWECDGCQAFIFVAEDYFKANGTTEAELLADMHELCDQLPKDVQFECNLAVDVTGPIVIPKILSMDPPKEICQDLKMCPPGADLIVSHAAHY